MTTSMPLNALASGHGSKPLNRVRVFRQLPSGRWRSYETPGASLFDAVWCAMPHLGGLAAIVNNEILFVESGEEEWRVCAGRVKAHYAEPEPAVDEAPP